MTHSWYSYPPTPNTSLEGIALAYSDDQELAFIEDLLFSLKIDVGTTYQFPEPMRLIKFPKLGPMKQRDSSQINDSAIYAYKFVRSTSKPGSNHVMFVNFYGRDGTPVATFKRIGKVDDLKWILNLTDEYIERTKKHSYESEANAEGPRRSRNVASWRREYNRDRESMRDANARIERQEEEERARQDQRWREEDDAFRRREEWVNDDRFRQMHNEAEERRRSEEQKLHQQMAEERAERERNNAWEQDIRNRALQELQDRADRVAPYLGRINEEFNKRIAVDPTSRATHEVKQRIFHEIIKKLENDPTIAKHLTDGTLTTEDVHRAARQAVHDMENFIEENIRKQTPEERYNQSANRRFLGKYAKERDEREERDREYRALNDPLREGQGRIIVRVINKTDKVAYDVYVKFNEQKDGAFIIRGGKKVTQTYTVQAGSYFSISVTCATHSVEPESIEQRAKRRDITKSKPVYNQGFHVATTINRFIGEREIFTFTLNKIKEDHHEKPEKTFDKKIHGMRVEREGQLNKIVKPLMTLAIGFIAAAILQQMWFFLAAMAYAAYLILPPVLTTASQAQKMEHIKERYERIIHRAEAEKQPKDVVDSLYKRMETELSAERMIGEFKYNREFFKRHGDQYGKEFGRESCKMLSFVFVSVGFLSSALPLAPVIGLIAGFAGYFLLGGGEDYHHKEEEKKHE